MFCSFLLVNGATHSLLSNQSINQSINIGLLLSAAVPSGSGAQAQNRVVDYKPYYLLLRR